MSPDVLITIVLAGTVTVAAVCLAVMFLLVRGRREADE